MIHGRRNRLAAPRLWLCLAATVAAFCTAAPADAGKAQARLERIDGARLLYLRGAPYDRGFEYGRLLADDIRFNISRYLNVGIVQHWGIPRDFLVAAAAKMEPFIPDEVKQEMRGIAAGAGVDYQDILILNTHVDAAVHGVSAGAAKAAGCGRDLSQWAGPMWEPRLAAIRIARRTGLPQVRRAIPTLRGHTPACSGVAVMGHWTSDGRVLHGHNVDWTTGEEVQKTALLLVIAPQDGVAFVMPTHAGMVACNAGMNAAGITYSDMTSESADQRLAGMPLMIMARMLLEKARTLDEALAYLRQWPDTCGWNMILTGPAASGAQGADLRAVEISATRLKLFKPGDAAENTPTGAPIAQAVVRTNHFVDPEMFALACKRFGVTVEQGLVRAIADSSYQRYLALERRLRAAKRPIEPSDIETWLRQPPVGGDANIQSMVFDPQNQQLWIADAAGDGTPACNTRYRHVNLTPYFGRRRGPLLSLSGRGLR